MHRIGGRRVLGPDPREATGPRHSGGLCHARGATECGNLRRIRRTHTCPTVRGGTRPCGRVSENMLFEEGTYVSRNQVLFVIDQRQYRAKADKARAQLKKDEAQARKAKRDLDRIKPLYEQNAASQLDLDNAVAAYETAVASVGMSQADLDQAEQELGYTIVRSPISGHISERHVDLGTLVGSGGKSLLATIVKSV